MRPFSKAASPANRINCSTRQSRKIGCPFGRDAPAWRELTAEARRLIVESRQAG
jgi:hypothetical protein